MDKKTASQDKDKQSASADKDKDKQSSSPDSGGSDEPTTTVGPTITIRGKLKSDEDLIVKGRIDAEITSSKALFIENSGVVRANMDVASARISGVQLGDVTAASKIEIASDGRMIGDLLAPRIVIQDGAAFRGSIDMPNFDTESEMDNTEWTTTKPAASSSGSGASSTGGGASGTSGSGVSSSGSGASSTGGGASGTSGASASAARTPEDAERTIATGVAPPPSPSGAGRADTAGTGPSTTRKPEGTGQSPGSAGGTGGAGWKPPGGRGDGTP